jgi:hypothetical protein
MAVRDAFGHRRGRGRLPDASRAIEEEQLEERARVVGPVGAGRESAPAGAPAAGAMARGGGTRTRRPGRAGSRGRPLSSLNTTGPIENLRVDARTDPHRTSLWLLCWIGRPAG